MVAVHEYICVYKSLIKRLMTLLYMVYIYSRTFCSFLQSLLAKVLSYPSKPPFNFKIPSALRYILTSLEFNCTQASYHQVAWLSCGGVATEAATRKVPFKVDARGGKQGGLAAWLPCCLWPVACAVLQPVIRFVMACHYHESPV